MNNLLNTISKKIPVPVLVFSVLYLLLVILSRNIPMFWDMSNISWESNLIYDSHFTKFIFPISDIDQGAAPLYSIYLAALWKVFGKTLAVSHIAILPFVLGIVYQFHKLASRFIQEKHIWLALLLLFIEPTIFTQTYLAGIDLVFCFLFLLSINSAVENKKIFLLISLVLLPLLRLRGFTFVISIFLIDFYLNREVYKSSMNFIKKRFVIYFTPVIVLGIWLIYHYYTTGWFFISENTKGFHHWAGALRMTRNIFYILWKTCDFGRIFLFAAIFILFFRKQKNDTDKKLIILLLLTIIPYVIFIVPHTYPVSHRHFMITYILGIISFVYFVSTIKINYRRIIFSLIALGLLGGNFWIYPEKYGNGWDSSMKVYPYFKIKNDFDNYVKNSGIDPFNIGAKAPMDFDLRYSNLDTQKFGYYYIKNEPLKKFSYVVQSNICNTFTPCEIDELNKNWKCEKEFSSWPVYIKLFRNTETKE